MGIFTDYFERYLDCGLVCVPCGDKKNPLIKGWDHYCENHPSAETAKQWMNDFPNSERLGLTMGQVNGIVAFDYDAEYDSKKVDIPEKEFNKAIKDIEKNILSILPPSPCGKVGKKGWTRFYKWNPLLGKDSNMSVNFHGVRLFDFLSWHKQTIIPPSIHSIQKGDNIIRYKWLDGLSPIEDCKDDLPDISLELINEIKSMFGTKKNFDEFDSSRHGRLLFFASSLLKVEKSHKKIIDLMVAKDIEINSPPYLTDPKHHITINARDNAAKWLPRITKWAQTEQVKGVGLTDEGWDYFFDNSFYKVKKDIISKNVYIKRDAKADWEQISSLDGVLRSYAARKKLNKTNVTDEMERWTFEKSQLEFLCDIPPWDGTDRVQQFADCLSSSKFLEREIGDIFKQWGSNIFRRVDSSANQNRCIILKGLQGKGKDTFVKSMFEDFKPYYEQAILTGTTKDVLEVASRLLIVHIEEFEQTKGLDVAFIKSLITQPSSFFREAYGYNPNQKIMRPSFISTSNVDDILRDPTGNRRFIVLPIDNIQWRYKKGESLQVMAQLKYYSDHEQFNQLDVETEKTISKILDEYAPEDVGDLIVESYKVAVDNLMGPSGPLAGVVELNGQQALQVLGKIARDAQCSLRRVQSVLKGRGFAKRQNDGMHYLRRPELV